MACLLLLPHAARAGTYAVSYSGGTLDATSGDGSSSATPFALLSGYYSDSGGVSCRTGSFDPAPATTCSSKIDDPAHKPAPVPITATFTWTPAPGQTALTDPPPASAVVQQYCEAQWSSTGISGSASGGGAASNGLGSPVVVNTSSANSTGSSYSAGAGGASFSVTCTPTATFTGASGTATHSYISGITSIDYNASAYPVTISLGGTTPDSSGNPNILIGQGCTAYLQAGSLPGATITFSNFNWAPQDPVVFAQYQMAPAPDQSTAQVIPVASSEWTKPSPHWYYSLDSNGGSFLVSCTATASVNGTAIGTVTGQRSLTVWKPYYYMSHNAGPTGIYGSDVSTGGPGQNPPGMNFVGAVGTPALFVTGTATGSWLFVQLVNSNHTQWYGFSPIPLKSGSQGIALDNAWPYASIWPADSTANASTPHSTDDSPDLLLNNGVNEFLIADTYQMYMMYLPPGNDSQYVPLHRLQWEWNTPDAKNAILLGWLPANASGSVTVDSDLRWETHPTWSRKYTNQ